MLNVTEIKKQFPIFDHYPELIFADNASTSQKPQQVIQAIAKYYEQSNANVHRAVYDLGVASDEIFESTRKQLCQFYNKEACIFTGGTTDGFNKLARALEGRVSERSNVIVSEMEHHSNLIPWQEFCRRTGAELRLVRLDDDGGLDLSHLDSMLDDETRIVSLVHISNTLGTINDLEPISKMLKEYECSFLVDAAQSCSLHQDLVRKIEADAILFGAHKMFGPSGLGVILAKKEFLSQLDAFNYGGGMVTEVESKRSEYRNDLSRFEGGTPPLAQVAGLSAALDFLASLDLLECCDHVAELGIALQEGLASMEVKYLSRSTKATGIVAATFADIHPHDVASFMNDRSISVRAGHHCTQLIMKRYEIQASVRFSFSIYNQMSEVDKILETVVEMKKFFS